ncbi:hypothetical protein M8J77_026264 [Diaphorina citri]|nr:hypothetical protein M8J77_026264 [Diaphorina citri]
MSCPFKKMKMTGEAPDNSDKDIRDISHDRQLITQINDESEEKEIEDPISEDENRDFGDLREFAILDEANDSEDEDVMGRYEASDSETELSQEAVEALLKSGTSDFCVKEKFDMDKFTSNDCEDLPPDWVRKEYSAGIPFYVHVPSNIVSTTRPYMLGTGSIKKHKLCTNAIPCLDYMKRHIVEQSQNESGPSEETNAVTRDESLPPKDNTQEIPSSFGGADIKCHADSVQNKSENFMTHEEVVKYFKKLYKYKTITMRRFSSWKMKRAFVHKQKCQNKITKNIPAAPEGTVVISVPMLNTRTNKLEIQDWSLNPKGKSYVCILHEYLQRAVKTHPVYDFKELENAKTPYLATIKLNDMQYGSGIGSSKRIAKLEAAKATLEILLPQLKNIWKKNETSSTSTVVNDEDKYSLFDSVKITDPKVTQYCKALGEAPPYSMLLSCIEKNFEDDIQEIKQSSKPIGKDKFLFTMEIEGYSASVKCSSKKEGKQLASQTILQQLHPQVHYLGSLLRLYGNAVLKGIREKKSHGSDENKVPKKKIDDSPNFEVLRNLRDTMNVIYADRKHLLEMGCFKPPPDIDECVMNMYKEMKSRAKNSNRGMSVIPESNPNQTSISEPDVDSSQPVQIPDQPVQNCSSLQSSLQDNVSTNKNYGIE